MAGPLTVVPSSCIIKDSRNLSIAMTRIKTRPLFFQRAASCWKAAENARFTALRAASPTVSSPSRSGRVSPVTGKGVRHCLLSQAGRARQSPKEAAFFWRQREWYRGDVGRLRLSIHPTGIGRRRRFLLFPHSRPPAVPGIFCAGPCRALSKSVSAKASLEARSTPVPRKASSLPGDCSVQPLCNRVFLLDLEEDPQQSRQQLRAFYHYNFHHLHPRLYNLVMAISPNRTMITEDKNNSSFRGKNTVSRMPMAKATPQQQHTPAPKPHIFFRMDQKPPSSAEAAVWFILRRFRPFGDRGAGSAGKKGPFLQRSGRPFRKKGGRSSPATSSWKPRCPPCPPPPAGPFRRTA